MGEERGALFGGDGEGLGRWERREFVPVLCIMPSSRVNHDAAHQSRPRGCGNPPENIAIMTSLTATLIFSIPIELGGGEWIWEEGDLHASPSACDDCVENPVTDPLLKRDG